MRDDDYIVVAGLVLLVMASRRDPIPWGDGWHWPVPDLLVPYDPAHPGDIDYPALITQEFRNPDHLGVDIGYKRHRDDDKPEYQPPHDAAGEFFNPSTTPIVAAKDGTVWSVGRSRRGLSVVISHGGPFATFYQHLSATVLPAHANGKTSSGGDPMRITAGQLIGTMGFDPIDPQGFRHLHFAVWYKGAGDSASVDPTDMLRNATRSTWELKP